MHCTHCTNARFITNPLSRNTSSQRLRSHGNVKQKDRRDISTEKNGEKKRTRRCSTCECYAAGSGKSRDNNVSTVATFILPFSYSPISLALTHCQWFFFLLPSFFSSPYLSRCSFTLGWKASGRVLNLLLQPRQASQRHRAILGNRIKGEKVQKYRRGVRQRVTAREGKSTEKRDYEIEMERVGRSQDTSSHVLLQRVKNVVQRWESRTDWL